MTKSYPDITQDISSYLGKMRREMPEVMAGFGQLAAATTEGALDLKTKELIALAIGVACRCDGCIGFHTQKLVKLEASREEVMETLGMSVYMGGGPALMYAADALKSYEEFLAIEYPSRDG